MRNTDRTRRNNDLRAYYERLASVKDHDRQRYSIDWMVAKTAHKFYLTPNTVEQILWRKKKQNNK